jgi:purine-binding chemotaxis protein CheW
LTGDNGVTGLKGMDPVVRDQKTDDIVRNIEEMPTCTEELYQNEGAKEETRQFVVFRLSHEWFAVEMSKVMEVTRVGKITYLPFCAEHIAGITSLRGNILPVLDLKVIFNLPPGDVNGKERIVAVESGIFNVGFRVDEVVDSIDLAVNRIEPLLPTLPVEESGYFEGQCQVGSRLVALVNVEKILEKGAS